MPLTINRNKKQTEVQFLYPHNTFLQAIINAKFTEFVLFTDHLDRWNKTLFHMCDLMTSRILPANCHASSNGL